MAGFGSWRKYRRRWGTITGPVPGFMRGTANCGATLSGMMTRSALMSGTASCGATLSAVMTRTALLSGSADCGATASATLTRVRWMSGTADCGAEVSGVMSTTPTPTPNVWTQRRAVAVTNSSGSTLTNHQIMIPLDATNFDFSSSNLSGSDIRVTLADETTLLTYAWDSFDPVAEKALLCVKVPSVATGSSSLYIFSANPDAEPVEDADATFIFHDDFKGVPGWNRYEVKNPLIGTGPNGSWNDAIVGDPSVIPPDVNDTNWGMFFFGAKGDATGSIGYASSPDGKTWTEYGSNPVAPYTMVSGLMSAVKPSVVWDSVSGLYQMAYAALSNTGIAGNLWHIRRASAPARTGPWTDHGILLQANGTYEASRVDCPCWFRDAAGLVRLYYSGAESIGSEPLNFCLATAANFTSGFTRYGSGPIAVHDPAVYWKEKALGGMYVRQLADGTFDCVYNAFNDTNQSRMGRTSSADGYTWNLQADDLMFELGPDGSWDSVRQYKPCIYTVGGIDRLMYNALYNTECIGYAEYGLVFNEAKWTPVLQNYPTIKIKEDGLELKDASTGFGNAFVLEANYIPGSDVVIETRVRVDSFTENLSQAHVLILGNKPPSTPFPNDGNLQFFWVDNNSDTVRHQNRDNGNWGGEDTVYNALPAMGVFHRYRTVKKAASMDYAVLSDARALLGEVVGNTDAPQNMVQKFGFGARGTTMTIDRIYARKHASVQPTTVLGSVSTVSKTF